MLWSTIAALLFCLGLMNLLLIIDLLQTEGSIVIPVENAEEFDSLELFPPPPELSDLSEESGTDGSAVEDPADTNEAVAAVSGQDEEPSEKVESIRLDFEEHGILPTVWWSRGTIWQAPLSSMFRNFGYLQRTYPAITCLILSLMLIGLLHSLATRRLRALTNSMGFEVSSKLQRDLHRQALRLGPADLDEAEQNKVIELFTNGTEQIRNAVQSLAYSLSKNSVQLIALLLFAISIHWLLALSCILPLVGCWYLVKRELVRFEKIHKQLDANTSASLMILSECFKTTRLVRAYNMEQVEHSHFQKHLDQYLERATFATNRERWSRWYCRFLIMLCASIVLILICMKVLLSPSELPLAAGLILLFSFVALHWPMAHLVKCRELIKEISRMANPIFRYLDMAPPVSQAVGAKFLPPLASRLSFESIGFNRNGKANPLKNIDLKITAGEAVALISLDPFSAKTLAYLIPRFIEPSDGRVLIDGEDIAWGTLESLRAEVAFVGGSELFFNASVKENISCGDKQLSDADIVEAAKKTRAHNFILKLPQGYETVLGNRGESLNAGEAFRLGLARALVRKPALLIIEEPTDILDSDTKALLEDTYNRLTKDRTVIFLPHRLSTVRRADRIILIKDGAIEAIGTHTDLVKNSPEYRHWEYMNFNTFQRETSEIS